MYNDYYLQEISNKITTTNTNLQTIITNQEDIQESITNASILVTMAIAIIIIYKFIERALR